MERRRLQVPVSAKKSGDSEQRALEAAPRLRERPRPLEPQRRDVRFVQTDNRLEQERLVGKAAERLGHLLEEAGDLGDETPSRI